MKDVKEGLGEFVVSGSDSTVDLEVSDHSLDAIALAIDALVPADFGFAGRLGRNAATDSCVMQTGADCISVVAFVREQIVRLRFCERHHVLERRAVRCFAGCEMEGERETLGITETMNFTGEPAPRAAKCLFAGPPFAPAAET